MSVTNVCKMRKGPVNREMVIEDSWPILVKSFLKPAVCLCFRCLNCIKSGQSGEIIISIDGGTWYQKKVAAVLKSSCSSNPVNEVPLLPTVGWKKFPSQSIPKGFSYGTIYEHVISTAAVYDSNDGKADSLSDFSTSKPMLKGRKYFLSGHVKGIEDNMQKNCFPEMCGDGVI